MMRFEWNALRVGDTFRIHRDGGALQPGTIAFVNSSRGSSGTRSVACPLGVHAEIEDTDDPRAPSLRCVALRNERS